MTTPDNAPVIDIVLRDGSTLVMRAAVRVDVDRLVAFTTELSQESRYYRFFGIPIVNRGSIGGLVPDTPAGGMAVVGECGGRIVAFADFCARFLDADDRPVRALAVELPAAAK